MCEIGLGIALAGAFIGLGIVIIWEEKKQ